MCTEEAPIGPILIIGADGLIGKTLASDFESSGNLVWKTTRHREQVGDGCILLDISSDPENWLIPSISFHVAVICAAITSIEQCRIDPIGTAKTNIDGVVSLANLLINRGVFVVFLSSNLVFDGNQPFAKSTDPVNPITEYGRQKALVEQKLMQLSERVSIVRFSKILGPDFHLYRQWKYELSIGNIINPFNNVLLSPVPLRFATQVLHRIAIEQIAGITQVSATQDISYHEVAQFLARKFEFDFDLIQPKAFTDRENLKLPFHTTLDIFRLNKELCLEVPDIWETVDGIANQ